MGMLYLAKLCLGEKNRILLNRIIVKKLFPFILMMKKCYMQYSRMVSIAQYLYSKYSKHC